MNEADNKKVPNMYAVKHLPYLNRAFSAPRICTVDAGYLAKFVRLPAWAISLAPTWIKANIHSMFMYITCQEDSTIRIHILTLFYYYYFYNGVLSKS